MKNFRELYCERYGLAPERYEKHILWRSLHWRGRLFFWLPGLQRTFYKPDFEYVRGVGELRSRRGFHDESTEFHYHPGNRGFFRRVFLMRVSSRRLQAHFEREISHTVTTPPF
jgi:hypothetical protein